jgi:hypothetical protein
MPGEIEVEFAVKLTADAPLVSATMPIPHRCPANS